MRFLGSRSPSAAPLVRGRLLSVAVLGLGLSIGMVGLAQDRRPPTVPRTPPAPAGTLKPGDHDSLVAKMVMLQLPREHISGRKVDDQISGRALTNYLKALDPLKLYFYQSDIDDFQSFKTQLDDLTIRGDLSPAYTILTRFLTRVNERLTLVNELLQQPMDFDQQDSIIIAPDAMVYANNADEARDRWRRQLKLNFLDLMADNKTHDEIVQQLQRRYSRSAKRWAQIDSDEVLEIYLTSLTMGYDPHTTYMSPSTLNDFSIQMRLNLEGIGAALQEKDGYTTVSSVIVGGAADRDGRLKKDDQIVSVGQSSGEMVDIVEMPLKQVVSLIRGNAGTVVRIGVRKGGIGETVIYELTRSQVQLEDSAARGTVIHHTHPTSGAEAKIGYINLPSFYLDMEGARRNSADFRSSTRDVRRILAQFREAGVQAVVLDLSRNGGGSLPEAIDLTGLFIDRGPVVQVKDANGSVVDLQDKESGVAWDGPLVVMTSKLSASASEILAGAIKDYGRGIIVGDPATHGKGTVQTLKDLGREMFRTERANYGALKVTIQQFYLPDGDSTQLHGVAADVILPSITSVMDISESDLDFALPHDRVPAVAHLEYHMVPGGLLESLRSASSERVSQDSEFLDLLRRKELYVRQKTEKSISLNEAEFMARRKQLDAQKEEEQQTLDDEEDPDQVYRDNYYNREVMNIAHDYLDGLKQNLPGPATVSVSGGGSR